MLILALAIVGGAVLWQAPRNLPAADAKASGPKILYYTCPMHPSVKAEKPGNCPICGMNLVAVYDTKGATSNPPATVNTNAPAESLPGCCAPAGGGCCQ